MKAGEEVFVTEHVLTFGILRTRAAAGSDNYEETVEVLWPDHPQLPQSDGTLWVPVQHVHLSLEMARQYAAHRVRRKLDQLRDEASRLEALAASGFRVRDVDSLPPYAPSALPDVAFRQGRKNAIFTCPCGAKLKTWDGLRGVPSDWERTHKGHHSGYVQLNDCRVRFP